MSLVVPRVRIELPERHSGQEQIVREAKRFNVMDCGRRFGKDILEIDLVVDTALTGFPVGWFAPVYKNLAEDWREVSRVLQPLVNRRSEQEHRLELFGGGVVDMWSLDAVDSSRGRYYKRLIVNEAAQADNLEYAWTNVLRPMLADYRGDAYLGSTPRGLNYFWQLYERGQDPTQTDWASWKKPTRENPFIHPDEIEAARQELPERVFAQEYLADFISDAGAVFRNVMKVCTAKPEPRVEGHSYVVGCDWGKSEDYSVFSVVDATAKRQVYQDRSNRLEYITQVGRLKALCDRYRPALVIAESNSIGTAIIEQLARAGIKVHAWTATNATKAAVIENLALAMEQQGVTLLDDPALVGELTAFEATKTPSGLVRYAAPEGMHDDAVIALSLAWAAASRPRRETKLHDFQYEA